MEPAGCTIFPPTYGKSTHFSHKAGNMNTQEQTKHTPGPWKVSHGEGFAAGGRYYVATEQGYDGRVAVASCSGAPRGDEEVAKANARLIAAAPSLLDACRAALARPGKLEGWQEEQIKAAIAKATN
jgi:hypothetical protein